MTSNKDYWSGRSERRLLDALGDADALEIELAKAYRAAAEGINDDIAKLYGKYAKDNALSYTDAMRYINGPEYRKWRMSLQEYVDLVELTGSDRLKLEVDTLAMRTRITRLDALMTQVKMRLVSLARREEKGLLAQLTGAFKQTYYRGVFDYQKRLGYLTEFSFMDNAKVDEVVRTPWAGSDFSTRIWKRTDDLTDLIRQKITTATIQGKSYQKLTKEVQEQMGVSYAAAKRLVQTETAFVVGQGELASYKESGVTDYEYLSTLDTRTSDLCQALDGKVFPVEEAIAGVNYPPMHPHCRSTTIANLEEGWDDPEATRIARDSAGKNITVPASMTYETWYNKHISKETESAMTTALVGLTTTANVVISSISGHSVDRAIERSVSPRDMKDAVENPLKVAPIRPDDSQKYVGVKATVTINAKTGNVVQVNPTASKYAARLKRKKGDQNAEVQN